MEDDTFDTFDHLLDVQAELQEKCYPELKNLNQEEQMLMNTRAVIHETIEIENELNWKHWKKPVPVNDEAVGQYYSQFQEFLSRDQGCLKILRLTQISLCPRSFDKLGPIPP